MPIRTVVEIDLVGYSSVARLLEENAGVAVVARLNDQIQEFVDTGLTGLGTRRDEVVLATTGDGAILGFETADDAHHFAASLHRGAEAYNAGREIPSAKRWFRTGAATGDLDVRTGAAGKREIAGIVIANAVRLEAASRPGEILIDKPTFDALSPELQDQYGREEIIAGKREERFRAYRRTVVPVPDSQPTTIQSVLDLFDRLNPRDQLDRLMLIVGMPPEHRPSRDLTVFRRQDQIVDWAQGQGTDGIAKLGTALNELIRKQPRY